MCGSSAAWSYGKHHQTYVTNLNNALQNHPDLQGKSVEDLCRGINSVPDAIRTAVRNNGGGHWNHSMFWKWMAPNAGGSPTGKAGDAINSAFAANPIRSFTRFASRSSTIACRSPVAGRAIARANPAA